jgi:hypothetical protein
MDRSDARRCDGLLIKDYEIRQILILMHTKRNGNRKKAQQAGSRNYFAHFQEEGRSSCTIFENKDSRLGNYSHHINTVVIEVIKRHSSF